MNIKLLIYFIFIFSTAQAQLNPVYKVMIERGWTPLLSNDKRELTHEQMDKEYISSMGYNDTIISNLKKIGVDFTWLRTMYGHLDEKYFAALSDCIVIGTVKRKEYPMEEDDFFHTIAYIKVEEFLRNDYNLSKSEIPVMIHSGQTSSGEILIQEGEDTLRIGENVLLFLSAHGLIMFAYNNQIDKLYDELINDPIISFKIRAKYDLKDGKVIGRDGVKDLIVVKDDINTVIKAIH
jgi:hypothetical protein